MAVEGMRWATVVVLFLVALVLVLTVERLGEWVRRLRCSQVWDAEAKSSECKGENRD
jgi:hypothetical protein